jgi:hypothetical protein
MSIDLEKVPDAPRGTILYAGVLLTSRHGKKHDLEAMMAALDWIADYDPDSLAAIGEIFCDTNAGDAYSAKCKTDSKKAIEYLTDIIGCAFYQTNDGYNSIDVESNNGRTWRDSDWRNY